MGQGRCWARREAFSLSGASGAVPGPDAFTKVHAHIDRHFKEDLRRIQDYLRQPSVAITGEGIKETASLTAQFIKDLGGQARVVSTKTHPIVHGAIQGASDHRLLRYDMYDVQPPEPLDKWASPPWAAEVKGDRVIARGAQNNKGPLAAYFNALQAMIEVEGELPCGIEFVIEGEEEIGSYALYPFVEEHKAELARCEAMDGFFPYMPTATAPPPLELGFKGCLFFEVVAHGPTDIHSMLAALVDNPAWRLTWALTSMRDGSDRVVVDGFYDDVQPPTPEERANFANLRSYLDWPREQAGVRRLRGAGKRSDEEMLEELFFKPSPINVQGMTSGWQGNGCKTITPGDAVAKVDIRIVAKQDGHKLLQAIRRHLDRHGFGDLEIRAVDITPYSKSPPTSTGVRAAAQACRDLGMEPVIVPTDPGTGPSWLFTNNPPLRMDEFFGGPGHGGNIHAPNEYFLVDHFRLFEKATVNYLHHWAAMQSPGY